MYIGAVAAAKLSSNSNEFANILLEQDKDHLDWLGNAMRVSCTDVFYSTYVGVVPVIHFYYLPGEFIVNIVLVPSMSEFLKLVQPTYASPSFMFHIAKGDVYASRYEHQTHGPNPPQRGL